MIYDIVRKHDCALPVLYPKHSNARGAKMHFTSGYVAAAPKNGWGKCEFPFQMRHVESSTMCTRARGAGAGPVGNCKTRGSKGTRPWPLQRATAPSASTNRTPACGAIAGRAFLSAASQIGRDAPRATTSAGIPPLRISDGFAVNC